MCSWLTLIKRFRFWNLLLFFEFRYYPYYYYYYYFFLRTHDWNRKSPKPHHIQPPNSTHIWTLIRHIALRVSVLIWITVLDLEPNPCFQIFLNISEINDQIFNCSISKRSSGQELPFIFFELRAVTAHFVASAQFVVAGDKLHLRWRHISSPPCTNWRLATKCAAVEHKVLGRQNVPCKSAYFVVSHRMDLSIHSDIYLLNMNSVWRKQSVTSYGMYILYSLRICTCTNMCGFNNVMSNFVTRFLLVSIINYWFNYWF